MPPGYTKWQPGQLDNWNGEEDYTFTIAGLPTDFIRLMAGSRADPVSEESPKSNRK